MVGIYQIKNKVNGKFYIGQSVNILRRWAAHKLHAKHKVNHPLYDSINKYELNNFDFKVIEECSKEDLNKRECYWIDKLHPQYNLTTGGDSNYQFCDATKEKIRQAHLGMKLSETTKLKMSESGKVKIFTKQHRLNLSKSSKGRKPCENFILAGKAKRKPVVCKTNGMEFKSLLEAALWLGNRNYVSNIKQVCIGKRKTANKLEWKFKGDE